MAGRAIVPHPLVVSLHAASQNSPHAPAALFTPLRRSTRLRSRYSRRFSSPPRQSPNPPENLPAANRESDPRTRTPVVSSLLGSLLRLLDRIRVDEISLEILYIALPAVLALAADPVASLVDTAFVGHLGSVELAAVGVSMSIFNLVSKLFNIPLLNITTSFVAEQQAVASGTQRGDKGLGSRSVAQGSVGGDDSQGKKFLPAVSTSLALAAGIGIVEAIALSFGAGLLMNIMGIPVVRETRLIM